MRADHSMNNERFRLAAVDIRYGVVWLAAERAAADFGLAGALRTFSTTLAARPELIGQVVSLIRHSARVKLHPHVQFSEFSSCSAAFFCSADNPLKSTPGNSVAFAAFFRNICPLSTNVSIRVSPPRPSKARISAL